MAYYESDTRITVGDMLPGYRSQLSPDRAASFVSDLAYDSRSFIRFPGFADGTRVYIAPHPFVNREGREQDPNRFLEEAVANGAEVIIYKPPADYRDERVDSIESANPREDLAGAAGRFYGLDKDNLPVFAATGTKGKTTSTFYLHHMLQKLIGNTGLVGSANYYMGREQVPNISPEVNDTWLTSLEPVELAGFIAELKRRQGKAMVVEATSHALALHRVSTNANLAGGMVTNFGADHLDFHGSVEEYLAAKMQLLDRIASTSIPLHKSVILNANDGAVHHFAERARHLGLDFNTVGLEGNLLMPVNYLIRTDTATGRYFVTNNGQTIMLPESVEGSYNAQNAAMAIALAQQVLGLPIDELANSLEDFNGVPGRFEYIQREPFSVVVDYAHEEMSLRSLLSHAREKWNRVVVVMSCTGDRDKSKRPKMGKIAAELADLTIITNDSTHQEDPDSILNQIAQGYKSHRDEGYTVIGDRKTAINRAIEDAQPGDGIFILGMGSERIMDVGGVVIPWNDSEVAREAVQSAAHSS